MTNRIDELSERALWFLQNFDEIDLADICASHEDSQKRAEAAVADYENRITWHTTCGSCARILDSAYQETVRAEKAEAALHEVLGAFEMYWARASYCGPGESAVQPEHFKAWRSVLQPTGHDTGPSVAECRRDNLRWPLESEGE